MQSKWKLVVRGTATAALLAAVVAGGVVGTDSNRWGGQSVVAGAASTDSNRWGGQ